MILPSYHLAVYQEESKRRIVAADIPYFILASVLVVLFVLMLIGSIQPIMLIVAMIAAFTKCF